MIRFILFLVLGYLVFQMVKKLLRQSLSTAASSRSAFDNQPSKPNRRSGIDQIQDAEYVEIDSKLKEHP